MEVASCRLELDEVVEEKRRNNRTTEREREREKKRVVLHTLAFRRSDPNIPNS